jgi:four helix bundle protein
LPGKKQFSFFRYFIPLCRKLPSEEEYNLIGQLKRAGLSVANNLAEGAARKSKAEKNRFFEVARSSIVEIDNCLIVCTVLSYLTKEEIEEVTLGLVELFKLISGLIDSNNR